MEAYKETGSISYPFLQGGGEMGALTRSYDWSATSLGSPDSWPQSLRTTLSVLLSSKFPMLLWWGADLIQFYNDAFRPSLGHSGKHPAALGQQAPDCWQEIWDIIGPLINQVRSTGEATWSEDQLVPIFRNGKIEDVYWTFSYSPVRGEEDNIDGVIVVCTETTDKVLYLKRLETANEQFTNLVMHAPVAIAVFRGENFIAETVNNAYLPIVGKTREEFAGRPLFESLPETRSVLEPLAKELVRTGIPFPASEFEITIHRNGKDERCFFNSVWEPLRETDGTVNGFIVVAHDITQQVAARKKTEESEERFRTLIEETTVANALYTGPEMRIQYANDTMIRYWGKGQDVAGKTFRELLPELENQSFVSLLEAVYKTGAPYTATEAKADIVVDGILQSFYFNFTYKPLRNAEGEIYGISHTAIDVTEQVAARKKTEESEQRVRSLVDSAPFPIGVYTGREMHIVLANQSILDVWGKGNDVIGRNYRDVLPELHNQAVFDQLQSVFDTGVPFHARNQHLELVVHGKKTSFYFNYSFTPIFDGSGAVTGVMNTAADVTDLNVAKQKVEENEKNIRNTILRAPVAMCIFRGAQHVVEIANDRMIAFWGRTLEDVLHKPIFEGLPEAKDQGFEKILNDVFTTGETFSAQNVPITLPRSGKIEMVYVNFVYEAYREPDGGISGIIAVATEVTEQVLARQKIEQVVAERTQELAAANSNLRKSNEELAQFAYIASHDLQEPLRKISTFSQLLEQSLGPVSERSRNYLDKINNASTRMLALIRDVLAYSQLSKPNDVFEQVDLQKVIDDIKSDFELLIEQKEAVINCKGLPLIDAIPLQMSQLFSNLISNALKFNRPDVMPVITITAALLTVSDSMHYLLPQTGTAYYDITVSDNGIGFRQEYAEQIFQIFQRLHGKTEYAGTGIGLAICKKIVQNHNGYISASAGKEHGAVFHVILPAKHTGEQ